MKTITVEVEMRAFMDGAIRPVDVPFEEWEAASSDDRRLDLIFHYGQNDFQPKRFCSVSVGDVIRLGGKRFLVAPMGFKEVA